MQALFLTGSQAVDLVPDQVGLLTVPHLGVLAVQRLERGRLEGAAEAEAHVPRLGDVRYL